MAAMLVAVSVLIGCSSKCKNCGEPATDGGYCQKCALLNELKDF